MIKYSIIFLISNSASVRLFKGFRVRLDADFDMIRNQINLSKGDASLADTILQQRAITTGFIRVLD